VLSIEPAGGGQKDRKGTDGVKWLREKGVGCVIGLGVGAIPPLSSILFLPAFSSSHPH